MKTIQLPHRLVEHIPERPEPGFIYISMRFSTAVHLCACGCGMEVVTPLKPGRWSLIMSKNGVSLRPSIGNWSFPCQSHYWILEGRVEWAGAMSKKAIAYVRMRDSKDLEESLKFGDSKSSHAEPNSIDSHELPTSFWLKLRRLFSKK